MSYETMSHLTNMYCMLLVGICQLVCDYGADRWTFIRDLMYFWRKYRMLCIKVFFFSSLKWMLFLSRSTWYAGTFDGFPADFS